MRRFIDLGAWQGVQIRIHWSLAVLLGLWLIAGIKAPLTAAAYCVAFVGTLLLHEWAHIFVARRLGYDGFAIELFPFAGLAYHQATATEYDHCLIAWAGVTAQAVVALPLLVLLSFGGHPRVEFLEAFFVGFTYLSLSTIPLNLLPIKPLDGSIAWRIVPILWKRALRR
jgi:Zn-dependent protease